jgi:hypothetical protein
MPVHSTHADYDASAQSWQRIRDVLAGEAAIKCAGDRSGSIPRRMMSSALTWIEVFTTQRLGCVAGYLGLIFRRGPVLQLRAKSAGILQLEPSEATAA